MTEYWQPQPKIVTPGKASEKAMSLSDALVLFDGRSFTMDEHKRRTGSLTVHYLSH